MSPKPDVSEERRTQIVEAAMRAFAKEGFYKARMEDIAEEAGLSKGALYLYFKSKDKIISAILSALFEREFSTISGYISDEGSAKSALEKMATLIADDLIRMRPVISIVYEFWAMSFRNKAIGNVIREFLWRYVEVVVPIFEQGVANGEFKPLDPKDTAMAFGSIIEGSIIVWSYDMDNLDFKHLMECSVNIFLDGISVQP
ncbi:TetR/AcrR family transcriptional regulator [bacterium]|nr:TetR/AcrR family transcriptional regulator [bacterium]